MKNKRTTIDDYGLRTLQRKFPKFSNNTADPDKYELIFAFKKANQFKLGTTVHDIITLDWVLSKMDEKLTGNYFQTTFKKLITDNKLIFSTSSLSDAEDELDDIYKWTMTHYSSTITTRMYRLPPKL